MLYAKSQTNTQMEQTRKPALAIAFLFLLNTNIPNENDMNETIKGGKA